MINKKINIKLDRPSDLVICSKCIYDSLTPAITFDNKGVCNYCHMLEDLKNQYGTGKKKGEDEFFGFVEEIKKTGKGKKYDCVIGVSGGTDSSFMVAEAIKWGLRPLAVHYDNTWNTATATENIRKVLSKLNVDLYTHVVDNKEADDIFKSFFKASVPDLDSPTDIALAEVLYRAADKYGVKYILEGHSFITEGVSPLGNNYIDGKYVKSVQNKFGKFSIKTFPNMPFMSFMKWIIFKKIKKIRPWWYLDYSKEIARDFLEKEFDWKYYGGHHLENRMTAFHHSYYNPMKFKKDQRNNTMAAKVREGLADRETTLKEYYDGLYYDKDLLSYYKKRLELSDEEFDEIMKRPIKSFRDYKTYKQRFEKLRPIFYILAKANLVPMSFYLKYTSKSEM